MFSGHAGFNFKFAVFSTFCCVHAVNYNVLNPCTSVVYKITLNNNSKK